MIRFLFDFIQKEYPNTMYYRSMGQPYKTPGSDPNQHLFLGYHQYSALNDVEVWNYSKKYPDGFYVNLSTGEMAGPKTNEGRLMKMKILCAWRRNHESAFQ